MRQDPLIDLTQLYTLVEWYHALQSYETTGSLRPVYELLEQRKEDLYRGGDKPRELAKLASSIKGVSRAFESGLPLEIGVATRNALQVLSKINEYQLIGPEETFLEPLNQRLERFALSQTASAKEEIALTREEIDRQRRIVEFYREKGRYWHAIECANELLLNGLLYEADVREPGRWLERAEREKIKPWNEDNRKTREPPSKEEQDPSKLWDIIPAYRNHYAHAGFKSENPPSREKINEILLRFHNETSDPDFWRLS